MTPDPTIDEIRRVRHVISRESGHDIRMLKETFATLEAQFERPPIDHGARRTKACTEVAVGASSKIEAR